MSYLVAKGTIPQLERETLTDFWLWCQELSHGSVYFSFFSFFNEKKAHRRDDAGEISKVSEKMDRAVASQDTESSCPSKTRSAQTSSKGTKAAGS